MLHHLSLRQKILLFFIILALLPLGIAGLSIISVSRDALKNPANELLISHSLALAKDIDTHFTHVWSAPLRVMRDAIDDPALNAKKKFALLQNGAQNLPDFLSLQLLVQDFPPTLTFKKEFRQQLDKAGLTTDSVFKTSFSSLDKEHQGAEMLTTLMASGVPSEKEILRISIRLRQGMDGHAAILAAHISLSAIKQRIQQHSFSKTGSITLADAQGTRLFFSGEVQHTQDLLRKAVSLLALGKRGMIGTLPVTNDLSEKNLTVYTLLEHLPWIVLFSMKEQDIYHSINKMQTHLLFWLLISLAFAILGGMLFSRQIRNPLVAITRVLKHIGEGNMEAKVNVLPDGDEINALGVQTNHMIQKLVNRYHFNKDPGNFEETVKEQEILAIKDKLTGLYNRRFFDYQYSKQWSFSIRQNTAIGVCLLDMDRFKKYNDQYGCQAGDVCLQHVARTLTGVFKRDSDFIARYGAEAFVILVAGMRDEQLAKRTTFLCEAVRKLEIPHVQSDTGYVSVSVGYINYRPVAHDKAVDVLKKANTALRKAKEGGGNQAVQYE